MHEHKWTMVMDDIMIELYTIILVMLVSQFGPMSKYFAPTTTGNDMSVIKVEMKISR